MIVKVIYARVVCGIQEFGGGYINVAVDFGGCWVFVNHTFLEGKSEIFGFVYLCMVKLEVITVDNGSSEYPGSFAKKEQEIIRVYMKEPCLHLFSGRSRIGSVRVDLSCDEATHKQDVFEYLEGCKEKFATVLLDPPYNDKFADKYEKLNIKGDKGKQFVVFADSGRISRLFDLIVGLDPEIIIMKSWYYYVFRGYDILTGFVCYAGGYRRPCFLLVEKRMNLIKN